MAILEKHNCSKNLDDKNHYHPRVLTEVCFKKTVTINSTVSLLWIVTVFLSQTLHTLESGINVVP